MNSRKNNPALIPVILVISFASIVTGACRPPGQGESADLIEFSSQSILPGAIGIFEDKLYVQDLRELGINIYDIDLGAERLRLNTRAKSTYLEPFNRRKSRKYLYFPARQILKPPPRGIETLILWGPEGYSPFSRGDETALVPPPPDAVALTSANGNLYATGIRHTYILPEKGERWIVGPPVGGGIPLAGLCRVPATGSFFAIDTSSGDIVELRISERAVPKIVNRHPPVTTCPFDMIYQPDEDVFWISDPERSIISRAKRRRIISSPFPQRDTLSSYKKISSDIITDETWDRPVFVQKTITVAEGARLTVEAGCEALFQPDAGLRVAGVLEVKGTAEKPVTLASPNKERRWGGIDLLEGASATMKYADLSGAAGAITSAGDLKIGYSRFSDIPGNGVQVRLSDKHPGRIEITSSSFNDIGGAGILVESGFSTAEQRVNISRNSFSRVGKAVSVRLHENSHARFDIRGNMVNLARKNVFKIESSSTSNAETDIEENIISRGAMTGACIEVRGTGRARIVSNFMRDCEVAAVYSENSGGKIETNVVKTSRAGIVVENPVFPLSVKGNKIRTEHIAFAVRDEKTGNDIVSPWGEELLRGGDNKTRGDFPFPLDFSRAAPSAVPSFLAFSVVSTLTRMPLPAQPVDIRGSGLREPITVSTNRASVCCLAVPEGTYAVRAEGDIVWREMITEAGELTEFKLDAP